LGHLNGDVTAIDLDQEVHVTTRSVGPIRPSNIRDDVLGVDEVPLKQAEGPLLDFIG
jgi:hypothetical protein